MRFSLIILLFLVGSQLSAQQTIGLIKANTSNTQPTLQQFLDSLAGIRASINNGGGGGESYGVASFNGRLNAVTPLVGDYSFFYAPIAHSNSTANPHSVTKTQVGLGNVDNTSDANKPISTATQTALDGKAATSHTQAISTVTNLQTSLDAKVPTSRTITINGVTQDLSSNRSFTVAGGSGGDTYITGGGERDVIYVTDSPYNAIPNDGIEDGPAFQAAIDAGILSGKTVVAPLGTFDFFANTLHLGYGDGFTLVWFKGTRSPYDASFKGSILKFHFDTKPCINIQGARKTRVSDLLIQGMNTMPDGYGQSSTPFESNYIKYAIDIYDNGLQTTDAALVDGRYKGHFGITIDAFSGTDSVGRFTAPFGWGKNTSSTVEIDRCKITQFVAAIVSHPSGSDGNGDFIDIHDNILHRNKYHISVCQTQARNINIKDNQIDIGWYLITTGTHGKQQGRVNQLPYNHYSGAHLFYVPDMATNGPLNVYGGYAEQLMDLGFVGSTSSSGASINFYGVDFNFSHENINTVPKYILNAYRASFHDCMLTGVALHFKSAGSISFSGESSIKVNASYQFDNALNWDANGGVYYNRYFNHPLSIYGGGKMNVGPGTKVMIDRHYGGLNQDFYDVIGSNGRPYINTKSVPGASGILGDYMYKSRSTGIFTFINRSFNGTTGVFKGVITTNADQQTYKYMKPGDALQIDDAEATLTVIKRNLDTVEAVLDAGFTYNGSTYFPFTYLVDTALLTDQTKSFTWYNTDWYDVLPVSGTSSTASPTISGITFNSYTEGAGNAADQIKAGSLVNYYAYTTSPTIPTSLTYTAKVVSVNGAGGSITLEGNAGVSGTVLLFNRYPYQAK